MSGAQKATDMLGMSDEDFVNLNGPPEVESTNTEEDQEENNEPEAKAEGEEETQSNENADDNGDAEDGDNEDEGGEGDGEGDEEGEGEAKPPKEEQPEADKSKPKETPAEPMSTEDYKAFYDSVMTFKANGKTIELKNPEEVKSLLQMGANYTRKMQAIKPHQKVLLMLENNDLLDEGKLSYLIDLDKKNPEAIKKLLKDSGIDPLDIDTAEESAYEPGNHTVTDSEASFKSVMKDVVESSDTGQATVTEVYTNWDDTSKAALWGNPELLRIVDQQRASGVYDLITTEITRRKTIGTIPSDTPFLEAYTLVGDEFVAEEAKKAGSGQQTPAERQPLGKSAGKVKSGSVDKDRAAAASPTRSSPKQAKDVANPLAMSDDDFLKQMEGRL